MKQIKKIVIVCLLITILMSILPQTSKAGEVELEVKTPGLTQEQQDYLVAYVRLYLDECYKMNPIPVVYDDKSGGYWSHYAQNELPVSELRRTGVSHPRGEAYSGRMTTVCSVFTGSMLHQALGVDLSGWGEGVISTSEEPICRGAGYSDPNGTRCTLL